jgi:hypothetical protein
LDYFNVVLLELTRDLFIAVGLVVDPVNEFLPVVAGERDLLEFYLLDVSIWLELGDQEIEEWRDQKLLLIGEIRVAADVLSGIGFNSEQGTFACDETLGDLLIGGCGCEAIENQIRFLVCILSFIES